jgi:hypothetical protein
VRRLTLLILVGCLLLTGVASAYDDTNPLPTLDEGAYQALIASFGGENRLNETTEGVDWLGIKDAAERPYTDLIGPLFYVHQQNPQHTYTTPGTLHRHPHRHQRIRQ